MGGTRRRSGLMLIAWLVLCFAAAAIGGIGSANAPEFFSALNRPDWAPPAWLFGPVWTVLYAMMAVAAWLVWKTPDSSQRSRALGVFVAQLALNTIWSWLFFAWRMGAVAFAEIIVLWLMIGLTTLLFWRLQRWAAILLLPYWAWVSFASVLCYSIWQRNPALLG